MITDTVTVAFTFRFINWANSFITRDMSLNQGQSVGSAHSMKIETKEFRIKQPQRGKYQVIKSSYLLRIFKQLNWKFHFLNPPPP